MLKLRALMALQRTDDHVKLDVLPKLVIHAAVEHAITLQETAKKKITVDNKQKQSFRKDTAGILRFFSHTCF